MGCATMIGLFIILLYHLVPTLSGLIVLASFNLFSLFSLQSYHFHSLLRMFGRNFGYILITLLEAVIHSFLRRWIDLSDEGIYELIVVGEMIELLKSDESALFVGRRRHLIVSLLAFLTLNVIKKLSNLLTLHRNWIFFFDRGQFLDKTGLVGSSTFVLFVDIFLNWVL